MQQDYFLKGLILFIIGGVIGSLTTMNSWDGMVYFYISDQRQPAAIQKSFDFSDLKGSALLRVSKERLITGARTLDREGESGILLGNYLVEGIDGSKKFACNVYNEVEMEFVAVGMAESGHIPTMKVKGPCLVGGNLNQISALWIPYEKILNESAGDLEMSFYDGKRIELSFEHIGLEWPRHWRLKSLQLVGQKDRVKVSEAEMNQLTTAPLNMVW